MKTRDRRSMQKLDRIRLVARTRIAWDQAREATHRGDLVGAARARIRLDALNRALALLALQG
jgi:hypothetical protein